jgi:hypothetical protein
MHKSILRLIAALGAGLAIFGAGATHPGEVAVRRSADRSAEHLACLKLQAPAVLTAPAPADGQPRLLRAMLVFTAADAPPTVSWLWKDDDAAAAMLALELHGSRMPCLESPAQQGVVQEFWWTPGTGALEAGESWPQRTKGLARNESLCYVKPQGGLPVNQQPTKPSKVLFRFRFLQADEPPEVEVEHRTGAAIFALDARRYVRRYQACAGGRTTLGAWHEQVFQVLPYGTTHKPQTFDLNEFLGRVKGAGNLRARFDTRTMDCPFQVDLKVYQPARNNEANVAGAMDANRHAFLSWLQRLQLDLPTAEEEALFYETVKIIVPCQLVDLK